MTFEFQRLSQRSALVIANEWKYDGVYSFYDMTADLEDYGEFIDEGLRNANDHYQAMANGELAGFFCVVQDGPVIEIGLGLRPDLCGKGIGTEFVDQMISLIDARYAFDKLVMHVAAFNQRAVKVYRRCGFRDVKVIEQGSNGGVYEFLVMEKARQHQFNRQETIPMVPDFEAKLNEYAHLLVEVGLNVQPGQTPSIDSDVEYAQLTRLCVSACYDCGARDVVVTYGDDLVMRESFLRADAAVFEEYPSYLKARFDWCLEQKCPRLSLTGSDPELLKGVDPARIQARRKASGPPTRPYFDALTANKFQWCVGAYPTQVWAEKVFPDKKGREALDALWDAIFSVCRITGDGRAVERWKEHVAATAKRARLLNEYQFQSLHYANSLGTDLTIRLPENHVWAGGSEFTPEGVEFVANMPTEEIFTAPRWDGVDGRVYAALPLALDGNLVQDFYLDFKDGRIVDIHAGAGEEILRRTIDTDEGSHYLGEVALVPYDSPIRNTGILFYETLFDENASCHLAFGEAYPSCVKGGEDMSEEEQKAAGLNRSITHVDFMVGTKDLSIVGVTHDGKEIPVFVDGNFAF